jgi:hypothetical protein
MSGIESANWLSIAGLLYTGCGAGFLIKALLTGALNIARGGPPGMLPAQQRVDLLIAAALMAFGFCLQIASNLSAAGLGPAIVLLLLVLSFALALYAAFEDSAGDAVTRKFLAARATSRTALAIPVAEPARVDERPSLQIVHPS